MRRRVRPVDADGFVDGGSAARLHHGWIAAMAAPGIAAAVYRNRFRGCWCMLSIDIVVWSTDPPPDIFPKCVPRSLSLLPTMSVKRAVLIGCNYPGSSAELMG